MANGYRGGRTPLGAFIYWTLVLGVWGLIFLGGFLAVFATDLPDTSKLYDVKRQPSITYLDRSGALVAVRGSQYAPPADLDTLPPYVPAAFVAIEDRQFYHHFGFNPWGMARSEIFNLTHPGGALRGGSTITQQLARNLFLTPAQTYRRKAQELILAVWLEMHFSKKQILALYLNRVNFGGGAYGIEAASQRYFNKPASGLTLGEAALLAATMKGPSRYNPAANSERAAKRATVVLNEMARMGVITAAERDQAFARPVHVSTTLANQRAQYFVDWLDAQVRAQVGEPTQDLVVETTLDLPIQAAAEQAVRSGVAGHAGQKVGQGALVAMDGEGRIRAYVGGSAYADSQFDRATAARRQAGSAFKPFVYLTAMEAGHTPSEPVVDEADHHRQAGRRATTPAGIWARSPCRPPWPSRSTPSPRGWPTRWAPRAWPTPRTGSASPPRSRPTRPWPWARWRSARWRWPRPMTPSPTAGLRVHGYGIERIRTAAGRVLYDHGAEKVARANVIGQPALAYMIQMMRQVIASGTGGRAKVGGYDLAGKTGTTSDYKDAWFVGYTGGFTAAVWVGKDDNTPMARVTGGGAPAEIWHNFMAAALPRLQAQAIPGGQVAAPPPADAIGDILSRTARGPRRPQDVETPGRAPPAAAAGKPDPESPPG